MAAVAAALAAFACGSAAEPRTTPSNATAAATADRASATAIASAIATTAAATATSTREPATATPPAPDETGITGIATIGPTCPVERADSPCPDRPYEASITIWRGNTIVAETRSGADGRFLVLVPAGEYRVVGESGDTFPRGTEATVTVVEGQMSAVELRFDSGIR